MTSQQQIAEFLDQRITWPRASGPFDAEMPWDAVLVAIPSYRRPARPSTSLPKSCSPSPSSCPCSSARGSEPPTASSSPGPSRWLTPSFYRQDVELLVAALQRAAQLQQQEGQQVAGRNALGAIGVVALVAAFIFAVESGSTA